MSAAHAPPLSPAAERLFDRQLAGPAREAARRVAEETARAARRRGGTVTLGWLSWHLASGLGVGAAHASRAGAVLDGLQCVIDLADNLADEALDAAAGEPLAARYPGVARETLHALGPLMMGSLTAALLEDFPAPAHDPAHGLRRALDALARMAVGQARPADDPARVDDIAGAQATLLCLPLWLLAPARRAALPVADVERWAFAYGRLWQLRLDVLEGAPGAAAREADARALARDAWPRFAPFRDGDALSRSALLGGAP